MAALRGTLPGGQRVEGVREGVIARALLRSVDVPVSAASRTRGLGAASAMVLSRRAAATGCSRGGVAVAAEALCRSGCRLARLVPSVSAGHLIALTRFLIGWASCSAPSARHMA